METNRERMLKNKNILKIFVHNPFKVICETNDWLCNQWYGNDCYYRAKYINNKTYPCRKMLNQWLCLCVDDIEWNWLINRLKEE